jgi:methionyl-tRNA synthetase
MASSIPQPPGLPFIGNVLDINQNDTWGSLKKLADKYGKFVCGSDACGING